MIEQVRASLAGIATGDAIGKQTETLSPERLRSWYPHGIRGFEGVPGDVIPRYAANRKRQWRIGETTDDTERTLAVARAILQDGRVDHTSVGREMLSCTKCLHPGLPSLWEFHQAGDPSRIADRHDGCGAAIRVAPVGILFSSRRLDDIVAGARQASIPTHGGTLAIAAAAATAAAVSAAIDGADAPGILDLALRAASSIEHERSTATPFADAVRGVHDAFARTALQPGDVAARCFPDSPLTIVPLALALATIMQSAEEAILLAANVGGDSDSVASIAGGILGARFPETVNGEWLEIVERVNGHDLATIAEQLAALRVRRP